MIQNFGSNPQINCKTVIEIVITINFLYFKNNFFMLTAITSWTATI